MKERDAIPSDYNFYKNEFQKQEIIINQLSECSHISTHYLRNIDLCFQDILDKDEADVLPEELINAIDRFEYFLINITTNLQSYFSQITDDNCSITIKLLNFNNYEGAPCDMLKTYYRDNVNFKKRSSSGVSKYCLASSNTAFNLIMNPDVTNTYFAHDDLDTLYKEHNYINPNTNWNEYYTSTIVVPISVVSGENQREILGFLSVDNFKGGLAINSNKEFLFSIADLLYLAFGKYNAIINLSLTKGISHDKISKYTSWN